MSKRTILEKSISRAESRANSQALTSPVGRRAFLKRIGVGSAAVFPASGWLATEAVAKEDKLDGDLNRGDVAILRFLAAAETLEADLWQQYNELALGNAAFQQGLQVLDGDMPTYVNQNTRNEFSHQDFLNAYLVSKGQKAVSLEKFRTLPSSQASGANTTAKRLTNLMSLTIDTSWFTRYRSTGNLDFGDTFPQIVNLVNVPAIPNSDLPIGGDDIQVIANAAGFHFATIEQGGSSLYDSMLPKASSLEAIKIIAAIGGSEVQHFEIWQDKAGNAPPVPLATGARFPQLPIAPDQTPTGVDVASPEDTNQVMARPCKFINSKLPLCAVIRPTSTAKAGATAAVTGLTASGLFNGQSQAFFKTLVDLAEDADEATRRMD